MRSLFPLKVSNKAMAKKDEIADVVAKFKEGRFRTFDELARLVHQGVHVVRLLRGFSADFAFMCAYP